MEASVQAAACEIYVDPPSHHFLEDRLFVAATNPLSGDDILGPYVAVRDYFTSRGIPVHTADRLAPPSTTRKLYFSFGRLDDLPRFAARTDCVVSSYFAMECPIVEPTFFLKLPGVAARFRRVYSWSDTESLLPYTRSPVPIVPFSWPQSRDAVHPAIWAQRERRFLVMINANKLPRLYDRELYTERIRAVEFFQRTGEIDLYGPNWTRAPRRVGETWMPATLQRWLEYAWEAKQKVWPNPLYRACAIASRGTTDSKLGTLGQYTFALCFENMILKGWMTEKLFDCLFAGTIPIYWGDPDVLERVPEECFIDFRKVGGYPQLRSFLHALDARTVERYRRAGREFLASGRFDPFRRAAFVDLFRRALREDVGLAV